jgi:ribulose-5-phosphate 4-epimerase/fuculose-1-phosphate aldolase
VPVTHDDPPAPASRRSGSSEDICTTGHSLFARGLTHGRTGNLSVRLDDRVLVTPSGVSLGDLTPVLLAEVALDGTHLAGPAPSKETFLHLALYRARPDAAAVAHTHSTHTAAVSCLADVDDTDALPRLTAYYAMRVGRLPRLPFHAPGDPALGPVAERAARSHHALLLANHGAIAAGPDLASAVDVIEEIEETARLFFLLCRRPTAESWPVNLL